MPLQIVALLGLLCRWHRSPRRVLIGRLAWQSAASGCRPRRLGHGRQRTPGASPTVHRLVRTGVDRRTCRTGQSRRPHDTHRADSRRWASISAPAASMHTSRDDALGRLGRRPCEGCRSRPGVSPPEGPGFPPPPRAAARRVGGLRRFSSRILPRPGSFTSCAVHLLSILRTALIPPRVGRQAPRPKPRRMPLRSVSRCSGRSFTHPAP